MRDLKVCENGHKMLGIGFEDMCPECEGRWVKNDKKWKDRLHKIHTALTPFHLRNCRPGSSDEEAKCLAEKFEIVQEIRSLFSLRAKDREELLRKVRGLDMDISVRGVSDKEYDPKVSKAEVEKIIHDYFK